MVATAFLLLAHELERQDKRSSKWTYREQIDTMARGFLGMPSVVPVPEPQVRPDSRRKTTFTRFAPLFKEQVHRHSNVSNVDGKRPLPYSTMPCRVGPFQHDTALASLKAQIKIDKARKDEKETPVVVTEPIKGRRLAIKDLHGMRHDDTQERQEVGRLEALDLLRQLYRRRRPIDDPRHERRKDR